MPSRTALGIALALTVALAGCQGQEAGGGGGQGQDGKATTGPGGDAQGAPKSQSATTQRLQTATRHASAARTSVADQDWITAKSEIQRVKKDLQQAEAQAQADVLADVQDARKLAEKAERSVLGRKASAQQELDQLVRRLNRIAVREQPIRAGGGQGTPGR